MKANYKILINDLNFPEGPYFDKNNKIWCVEQHGGNLVKLDGVNVVRYPTGGSPNGLVVDYKNHLIFCDSNLNAIRIFDPVLENFSELISSNDKHPLEAPNDLIFDSHGNLIFTCPGKWEQNIAGKVYCYNFERREIYLLKEGLNFPNGLAVINESKQLVVAETREHRLWIGKWDGERCQWIDPHPWTNVGGPVGPDGMVYSKKNLLYVAVFGSGKVKVLNNKGKIIDEINLKGKNVTNVTLDPNQKLGLIVTESEFGQLLSFPEIKDVSVDFDGNVVEK